MMVVGLHARSSPGRGTRWSLLVGCPTVHPHHEVGAGCTSGAPSEAADGVKGCHDLQTSREEVGVLCGESLMIMTNQSIGWWSSNDEMGAG